MSIASYIKETKGELTHVTWPSKKQTTVFTIIVVVLSILLSLFLGLFDYIFSLILQKFVL